MTHKKQQRKRVDGGGYGDGDGDNLSALTGRATETAI